MSDNKYLTTAYAWDDLFGNKVGPVILYHSPGSSYYDCDYEGCRNEFIAGLKSALSLPEDEDVTRDHLREMIKIAEGDWSDIETIRAICEYHQSIRNSRSSTVQTFLSKN